MQTQLTIDDKIEGLLEVVTALTENQNNLNDFINDFKNNIDKLSKVLTDTSLNINETISEDAKKSFAYLEHLAQKIVVENTLTKKEIENTIAQTAKEQFIEHLSTNLSNEIKENIQAKTAEVSYSMIEPLYSEVAMVQKAIQRIRQNLVETANNTKEIADNINQELKNGADEIVGNGVAQILDGVEKATQSYKNTVYNLQETAKKTEHKAQALEEFLKNYDVNFKKRILIVCAVVCFAFFIFVLLITGIFIPSKHEIARMQDRKTQLMIENNKLERDIKKAEEIYNQRQMKTIDGKLHIRVDRRDCDDDFCRLKIRQEK